MKYSLLIHFNAPEETDHRPARLPYKDAAHLDLEGPCPLCDFEPFQVRGSTKNSEERDGVLYAVAFTLCCRKAIGTLKVILRQSLFGAEEDARVLAGPWRVY